ncbi:conjugal transfer protein TraH [Photobacterium phosphoreum]|uniref:conjugal transfer protein TraH n=1 Tax=Photobacterium phosphoreum TaxID=659 RepID=UPI000D15ECD8|nr:conjugal transfer protein TraH [Photobacterium phosphoreum]PSW24709.1 conjugal transfer protein TraH [Photobacterium phosphoreum]
MKINAISIAMGCLLFHAPMALAGISSDMNGFYDSLGYNAQLNNPSAYKGQEADYYSAGSLNLKSKVRDTNLFQIQMPTATAGCGGIDLFAGGFSHINSAQLTNMGKAIVSDAVPFAVNLALQTWAPQIKEIMGELQAIADKFNQLSLNSCEAAQDAVSGLWPFKNQTSQKYICSTLGTQNNQFADWAAGMNDCGKTDTAKDMADKASKDPKYKEMVKKNVNIVWDNLQKQAFLANDSELAEFFMSLSGTIIYDKNGDEHTLPSLLSNNNNLINALMYGGKIKIYICGNKTTCLSPKKQDFTLTAESSLHYLVFNAIQNISTSIMNDTALNAAQTSFLELTDIPVLTLLSTSIQVGQKPDSAAYANVLAKDLTKKYLADILQTIQSAMSNSKNDKEDLKTIMTGIYQAQNFIAQMSHDAEDRLILEQKIIQGSQEQQKSIEGNFSARLKKNMNFEG